MPSLKRKRATANFESLEVCCGCGDILHQFFSNKQLEKEYNTLDKILKNDKVIKWIKWIQNKPNDFRVCMRRKK